MAVEGLRRRCPTHSRQAPKRTSSAPFESDVAPEERVLAQWRSSFGCDISSAAKELLSMNCTGRSFELGDIRLWEARHEKATEELCGKVYLEFFFDESNLHHGEAGSDAFSSAFETALEEGIQAYWRSMRYDVDNEKASLNDDSDPAMLLTGVSSISYRHAGCMMSWIVVQSSMSVFAAEALWNLAFPQGVEPETWPSFREDWRPFLLLAVVLVMAVIYVLFMAFSMFW
eukprot:gnl/MRDRNA2_/MRDRNA2_56978_c0_seq1.p1 gnl/MRDRNA2_/MRDRNA2_56978_c0~~gnl/MRDRNA2_/MRDRNA2_56978_c0_seq1.p1  ORF type:complete len:229 (-),score=38.65 gnl/MRDRNA2_/MRDRNA2_56978_c0_seq1:156-842(-)